MLEAASDARNFLGDLSPEDLVGNKQLTYAIQHALAILGEAANRVSDETQARLTEVEWRKIRGVRNRLIHEYHGVDLQIVWNVVTKELARVEESLRDFLQDENSP